MFPKTDDTVGPIPSTTIDVGDTAFAVTLPNEVESVRAGNVRVAAFPAASVIDPPPAESDVVAT